AFAGEVGGDGDGVDGFAGDDEVDDGLVDVAVDGPVEVVAGNEADGGVDHFRGAEEHLTEQGSFGELVVRRAPPGRGSPLAVPVDVAVGVAVAVRRSE